VDRRSIIAHKVLLPFGYGWDIPFKCIMNHQIYPEKDHSNIDMLPECKSPEVKTIANHCKFSVALIALLAAVYLAVVHPEYLRDFGTIVTVLAPGLFLPIK
jgi:hypothetical protein